MAERWTETEIAALLDGALEGEARARIQRLVDADPEARACAERLRETDALLRDAFAAPLSEPVPGAMRAILEGDDKVASLSARRRPNRPWIPAALAASVALMVGAVGGAFLAPQADGPSAALAGLSVGAAPAGVAAALETTPSGAASGGVRLLASFPVEGGGHCREFELEEDGGPTAFGLACRAETEWRVLLAADVAADPAAAVDGFAPASGVAVDAAGPVLDALGAGPALDPAAEGDAIRRGWR